MQRRGRERPEAGRREGPQSGVAGGAAASLSNAAGRWEGDASAEAMPGRPRREGFACGPFVLPRRLATPLPNRGTPPVLHADLHMHAFAGGAGDAAMGRRPPPAAAPAAAADYLAPRPPRPPRPPLPRPAGGKKPRMLFWPAAAAVPAFLAPPRPPPRPRPAKKVDTRGAGAVPDCRI